MLKANHIHMHSCTFIIGAFFTSAFVNPLEFIGGLLLLWTLARTKASEQRDERDSICYGG